MKLKALLLLALMALANTASALTAADFLKDAEFNSVALSPTGEYLAVTVPISNRSALAIIRLSDMKTMGVFKPESEAYIDDFIWVNDKRILFNTAKKIGRLEQPYQLPGLWGMDFDGANKKRISNLRSMLSDLPDDDDNILVQYYDSLYRTTYGLQNVNTGQLTPSKHVSPVKKIDKLTAGGYYADGKGDVLVFLAGREGTEDSIYFFRKTTADPWVQAYDSAVSNDDIFFMGFAPENKAVYFQRENSRGGPDSVIAIDMVSHQIREVLKDDNVDPYSGLLTPREKILYAVKFLDGTPRYEYLEPQSNFAIDHRKLRNSFPGQEVISLGYTKNGTKAMYYVASDRNPGDYYLYDRTTGKAEYVLSDKRWIDPEAMAETVPVKYKARDGLEIEALLTRPKGQNKGLPTVIYPHGGPMGIYDRWGFDSEVQFLASRGYAVLKVNFRGSGNYGQKFKEAGYRQWGRAMQDDLTDATHWLIAQGYANPRKICIYGASYGGYAALMGVAKEPGLYACAIGNVGVYDIPKVIRDDTVNSYERYSSGWWAKKYFIETIGTEDLNAISPVTLASAIKVPVLLAGGELDETAPVAHTKKMYEALKQAGVPVEMKIYLNEGHGNFLIENQLDWANRLSDFLDKHIGPASGS